jgi:hypothetical protein
MKLLRILQMGSFCLLLNCSAVAHESVTVCCQTNRDSGDRQHFGTATLSPDRDLWYTIDVNSYPETTPLSLNRNKGLSEGGVYLSPTGFTIGEVGNYWVSITAILQNPTEDSILIPVYLVANETLDPDDVSPIGGIVTLDAGKINSVEGTGILKNVTPGTRLSLVATHACCSTSPVPVTVISWSISLFKMP